MIFSYNTSRHQSTKHTLFELIFNSKATLPIDINLRKGSIDIIAGEYGETSKKYKSKRVHPSD